MPTFSLPKHRLQKEHAPQLSDATDVQSLQEENKQLKELVVQLSSIVLKNVVEAK